MNAEMSVNEAISRIQDHMRVHKMSEPRSHFINIAFEMAIDALKKQIPEESNMDKIKITIEVPGKKTKIIETDQALVLANYQNENDGGTTRIHSILPGASYFDTLHIGIYAINAVFENLGERIGLKGIFINEIEKILREEKSK